MPLLCSNFLWIAEGLFAPSSFSLVAFSKHIEQHFVPSTVHVHYMVILCALEMELQHNVIN